MMSPRLKTALAALAFAAAAGSALPVAAQSSNGTWQLRANQPAVMGSGNTDTSGTVQAAPVIPVKTVADFERAYRDAGSPKTAIFFNRTISDTPRSWVALSRAVISGAEEKTAVKGNDIDPIFIVRGNGGFGSAASSTSVGTQKKIRLEFKKELNTGGESGARDNPLSELDMERVRASFEGAFLDHGVNILDRAMMMRLQSRTGGSDDLQALEIDALKGHADLVLVAFGIHDPESPKHVAWRLLAMDVDDSRIVYSGLVRGDDLKIAASETWTATSGGFEKATDTDANPEEIGALLSMAVMNKLGPRL